MKKNIILFLVAFIFFGCKSSPEKSEIPVISVSILPQEYFVKRIAKDRVSVNVMIPPGASPATYEPTTGQLTSLSETILYLQMGYTGFEMAWMDKLMKSNPSMKLVTLSDGVDLIREASTHDDENHSDHSHHHGGIDPHVWLSPINASIIARNIEKALSESFPEYANEFATNLDVFLQEIDSLQSFISVELSNLSSRSFFTYHPSLTYFARDFDLQQYPLELGGKTPSPAHLKSLVDVGMEKGIGVVFLQMQFDQKNAEVLSREIDAKIVQIDPLDPDWKSQLIFITEKLKENLQ